MAIKGARFRGKVKIHGRPKEQASAEIMVMKHQESYEHRKRKRLFFTILDIIAIVSLLVAIYSFYQSKYLNGLLSLLIGVIILAYFIIRKSKK